MDLDGGFGEASPSHSAQAVTALPCPEDLLDPAPYPVDRLIPFFELPQRFLFVAAPHAGGDDPRYATLGPHSVTEVVAAIGAVGKHLTRIVGQRFGACSATLILADVIATSSINAVSASAPTWALKP